MNTAAPTTAHKKLVGILLTIVFALTCLPRSTGCGPECGCRVLLQAEPGRHLHAGFGCHDAAPPRLLDGRTDWVDVTENSVRSTAWSNGLAHSFTYREMQVAYATLPSNHQERPSCSSSCWLSTRKASSCTTARSPMPCC